MENAEVVGNAEVVENSDVVENAEMTQETAHHQHDQALFVTLGEFAFYTNMGFFRTNMLVHNSWAQLQASY